MEEHFGIEDHSPLLVCRINRVGTGYRLTDAVSKFRHDNSLAASNGNQVDSVAAAVGLLHESQGQGDARSCLAAKADAFTHIVIYTNNLVIDVVNADALAAGVTAAREQFLVGLLLNDAYLAVVTDIGLIDVSAVVHFRLVDTAEVGHGT